MAPEQEHYARRQAVVLTAATVASRQWAQVDPNNIATSWARQLPIAASAFSAAQFTAAQQADPYLAATAASEGLTPLAEYLLAASAFAGTAADGRSLLSLLYQPAITALTGIKSGQTVRASLALGAHQLNNIVRTEVADAGRLADQVSLTKEPAFEGYVRLTVPPSCNRCIILAGRVYPWSAGFDRHPACDCIHVPASLARAAGFVKTPRQVYDSMTPEERSKAGWSKDEQTAINEGANIAAVTNIHRKGSLYQAGGRQFTREAARKTPRPTVKQIYRDAHGDRDLAVRLLKRFGYIR